MGITRRNLLRGTAAGLAVAGSGFSTQLLAAQKTLKVGLNIPMTGDYAAWGQPGFFGCEIVAENINAAGGVEIGGDIYMIELVGHDHGYDLGKAVQGYNTLRHDDAAMVMMLGGATVGSIIDSAQRNKTLVTTLLPSDITEKTTNLLAPSESHPLYNATGVDWLKENFPRVKTAVIVTTEDIEYGRQSAAVYQAAFEVNDIEVLNTHFHGFDVTDFEPMVKELLASNPDVFCMATDVYTTQIIEALYSQGYEGKIISCTLDLYEDVIAKTSKEYVEGIIFQFPDFDDPALKNNDQIQFPDPNGFWDAFQERHPGQWSAVAWQYPAIMTAWIAAAQTAGSVDPLHVLAAWKANPNPPHTFGKARWWGAELYGLDNCAVGDWPVVTMQDGRARIVEFRSVYNWLQKHGDVLRRKMQELELRTV